MLVLKSQLSLHSAAPDRMALHDEKTLPKIAKAAGWPYALLADERTMAGSLEFLRACKAAKVAGSAGIQLSRLRVVDNHVTLILMPLNQRGLDRLVRIAGELGNAESLEDAMRRWDESEGFDLAGFVMPAPDFEPAQIRPEAFRKRMRSLGINPAVAIMGVNGEQLRHAPRAEAENLAEACGLPIVRLVEGLTDRRLDADETQALSAFAKGAKAAERLPERLAMPQSFTDSSVPRHEDVLSHDDAGLDNARGAFERIEVMTLERKADLPRRQGLAEGQSADDVFDAKARAGLRKRIAAGFYPDEAIAWERFDYEIGLIKAMSFSNYFLLMTEAIDFARSRAIPVGAGRGSAAGSIVCFALGITNIDPIRNKLIFERFLNPERVSLPDIDTDFCPLRRKEIFDHLAATYGDECVGQIATFGVNRARQAIDRAGIILAMRGVSNDAKDLLKSMPKDDIEKRFHEPLLAHHNEDVRRIGKLAKFLHNLRGTVSVHAGGFIISDTPLRNNAPLLGHRSDEGRHIIQFGWAGAEMTGFVKFDFLGLKTLTVMDHAMRAVLRNKGVSIDIDNVPLDEPEVYEMLRRGRTTTVFQLESWGMTEAGRTVGLNSFDDIVALVALYRPGPMANIDIYAERKHGRAPIEYMHPSLEPILGDTFGIMIYQEQIMQLAQAYAGYTMPEADKLRKVIGKKDAVGVAAEKDVFVGKATAFGRDSELSERIFEAILPFAQYGFNRSHAAAYALLAYQTAWLKRNHPGEWYAACATYAKDSDDTAQILREATRHGGFSLALPDVNASQRGYVTGTRDGRPYLQMPMEAVLGVGPEAAAIAVTEREANGDYRSLSDFMGRAGSMNRSQIQNMVWAGAFDCLSRDAPTVARPRFVAISGETGIATMYAKQSAASQMGLFSAQEMQSAKDPTVSFTSIDAEEVSIRQATALQNAVQHERHGIESSVWRRSLESLPSLAKAAVVARNTPCNTLGVLVDQTERNVPMGNGKTNRVIVITVEDEEGRKTFDVAPDCPIGPEVLDAKGRTIRVTLAPSSGKDRFIGKSAMISAIKVYTDPLSEPREHPAIVLRDEIDDKARTEIKRMLRAIMEAGAGPVGNAKQAYLLVVPPSRKIEVFRMPRGASVATLTPFTDENPMVASVLP